MITLTDNEFRDITDFMKTNYGIDLFKKKQLIESRMRSVLGSKGIASFTEYSTSSNKKPRRALSFNQ
jgi:chemotaxis protein methyltransferase CheR